MLHGQHSHSGFLEPQMENWNKWVARQDTLDHWVRRNHSLSWATLIPLLNTVNIRLQHEQLVSLAPRLETGSSRSGRNLLIWSFCQLMLKHISLPFSQRSSLHQWGRPTSCLKAEDADNSSHFHVFLCEREAHAFIYEFTGLAVVHSRPAVPGAVFFLEHVLVKHAVQTIQKSVPATSETVEFKSAQWLQLFIMVLCPLTSRQCSDPRPSPHYISRFFLRCFSLEINLSHDNIQQNKCGDLFWW